MKKAKCSTWPRRQNPLSMTFVRLIAIQLLSVLGCTAQARSAVPAALAHLQRGLNVGRFLDGTLENDSYECCSDNNIRAIRSMGFDHVRILVKPGLMFDFNKQGISGGKSLDALDQIVSNCVSQHLAIILALALDEPRFKDKLLDDHAFVEKLADFWKALANHYSTPQYPPDLVFFEVLNEPGLNESDLTDAQWSGIQEQFIAAIRQGATRNTILATGAQKSDVLGLLVLPRLHFDNVIFLFHYYEPYSFTHQGEDWEPNNYAKFLKSGQVKYPYALSPLAKRRTRYRTGDNAYMLCTTWRDPIKAASKMIFT